MNRILLRKIMVYSFFILLSAMLQFNYPDRLRFSGMAPDFLLVLPALAAYLYGAYDGMAVGIAAGLVKDIYAGRGIGLGALLCLYCALLAAAILRKFFSSGLPAALLQTILASFFYFTSILLLTYIVYAPPYPFADYLRAETVITVLPGVLMNAAGGLLFILLLRGIRPVRRGTLAETDGYGGRASDEE